MKKLEIIIKAERLEDLKKILNECQANGLMITNIMGYGKQKGYVQIYRGTENHVNLLPKVKVETVVLPEVADKIIDRVVKEINTGNYGDGKIFIYEVDDAIRIRTGERGHDALQNKQMKYNNIYKMKMPCKVGTVGGCVYFTGYFMYFYFILIFHINQLFQRKTIDFIQQYVMICLIAYKVPKVERER